VTDAFARWAASDILEADRLGRLLLKVLTGHGAF
jgi:hypothetical protein